MQINQHPNIENDKQTVQAMFCNSQVAGAKYEHLRLKQE